MDVEFKGVWR